VGNFAELGGAIGVAPAAVAPGQLYWRIIKIVYQDVNQSGGGHAIAFEVLDENGARVPPGQPVTVRWADGSDTVLTQAKPENEYPATSAMYGMLGSYTGLVEGLPSDAVTGMGLPMKQHVNFLLTFQRTRK
jgi:hypothetical protein